MVSHEGAAVRQDIGQHPDNYFRLHTLLDGTVGRGRQGLMFGYVSIRNMHHEK
jgi:hypothetical protein